MNSVATGGMAMDAEFEGSRAGPYPMGLMAILALDPETGGRYSLLLLWIGTQLALAARVFPFLQELESPLQPLLFLGAGGYMLQGPLEVVYNLEELDDEADVGVPHPLLMLLLNPSPIVDQVRLSTLG